MMFVQTLVGDMIIHKLYIYISCAVLVCVEYNLELQSLSVLS